MTILVAATASHTAAVAADRCLRRERTDRTGGCVDYRKVVIRHTPGLAIAAAGLGNLLPDGRPTVDILDEIIADLPRFLVTADQIAGHLSRAFLPAVAATVDAIQRQANMRGTHVDAGWLKLKLPIATFERGTGRLRVLILAPQGIEIDADQPDYITAPPTLDARHSREKPYYDQLVPRDPPIGADAADAPALASRVAGLVASGIAEELRRVGRHDWASGPVDVAVVTRDGAELRRAE